MTRETGSIGLVVAVLCLPGCGGPSAPQRPVTIVVSGDTAGWIVPCGCAANQSGGMPRRGSFVRSVAAGAEVLYLDAGGAPGGASDYDRAKFQFILQGERAMGLAAHNVGAGELELGVESLQSLAETAKVPLLCANATDREGRTFGKPSLTVERAGRRILVIGVVSPSFATADVEIVPPRRRILDILDQTAGDRDYTVVLAYLPEDELRQLAASLPEADLIVGGPTGQAIAPVRLGPALLAAATNKGKFLIRVDLGPAPGTPAASASVIEMNETWPDDPAQQANLDRFRTHLEQVDFEPEQTAFAPVLPAEVPGTYRVAGSHTCRDCHAADCTAWEASGHAHAWETLADTRAHFDPYCQQCHTTGYGLPAGFRSAAQTVDLANVGCESCHGPSAGHVADPKVRTAYFQQARNHCQECHDHDNSPEFDYATYWPRIEHGATLPDSRPSLREGVCVREAKAGSGISPRHRLSSLIAATFLLAAGPIMAAESPSADAAAVAPSAAAHSRDWIDGLRAGVRRAQADRQPLLVLAGSATCPWCRRLKAELQSEPLARELGGWKLAYVDVDKSPAEARQLGVGPVPALRILDVRGIRVAARDGFAAPAEIIGWLRQNYEEATSRVESALLEAGEPNVLAIVRLVRQLDQRDPTQREAAIQRLTASREQAAPAVVKAFREGNLATRLAALEILQQWQAPIDGLDPWQPETITVDRLARLDQWRAAPAEPPASPDRSAEKLSDDDLAAAREQIDRLLDSQGVLAAAIRGRLARYGPALLPEVYERLKNASNDEQRERLLALRYRLVASDSLVVRWPGGIVRLASSDVDERRRAAEQLADIATAEDQDLLLELFSDSDSLIRELSLRSLDHVGGTEARASLAKLLNDPEPNVRAAVLKRLAEDAPAAMVSQVAEYVKGEQDPDLLVHAIRYFKATPQAKSLEALLPLVKHDSWQVRAEAAEAIGSAADDLESGAGDAQLRADAYAALIELLSDDDAFVVSRAVQGLAGADMAIAVDPLVEAALTHPDLAPQIVMMLASGEQMRAKALPHVRKFRNHRNPELRAAAIRGLFRMAPEGISESLADALRDESQVVRLAGVEVAGETLDNLMQNQRRQIIERRRQGGSPLDDLFLQPPMIIEDEVAEPSIAARIFQSLFGGSRQGAPETAEPEISIEDPTKVVPAESKPPTDEPATDNEQDETPAAKPAGQPPAGVRPGTARPLVDPFAEPSRLDSTGTDNELQVPRVVDQPRATTVPVLPEGQRAKATGEDNEADEAESAEPPDAAGREWDRWLADFRQGRGRPTWTNDIIEPLTKMAAAEDPTERVAAARLLVALGRHESALPIIREAATAHPNLAGTLAEVLPWLTWEERESLYDQLMAEARSEGERLRIIYQMAEVLDSRAAERLWSLLETPDLDLPMAEALDEALAKVYFGETYYARGLHDKALRKLTTDAARPRAEAGSDLQRLVALVMLTRVAPEQAATLARGLADDPAVGKELRRDAFQILLAASPKAERNRAAAAALAGDDPDYQLVALHYFVNKSDGISYLRGYSFNLVVQDAESHYISSGSPIIPEAPEGIDEDVLLPLLKHGDLKVRASAAYLLGLLEDPQGLPVLIDYWRERPDDDARMRLVYRAIAVNDDSSHLPVLRDIYKRLDRYEMMEFYWTIRIMSGPEILSFRKQIRQEVGVDNLQ